jgi:hypothetical protein
VEHHAVNDGGQQSRIIEGNFRDGAEFCQPMLITGVDQRSSTNQREPFPGSKLWNR